jgi:hypothetical protein
MTVLLLQAKTNIESVDSMNTKQFFLLSVVVLAARVAGAQGTAFTYQGRLTQNAGPATGVYDLRFTLHDSLAGATQVAGPLSNPTVAVTNGLFTVALDFGAGAFNGSPRWLQIGVRTNGSAAAHTPLAPRQPVTAAPYAVLAGNVTGNIADSQLSANIARLDGNQNFTGNVNLSGAGNVGIGTALPVDAKLDLEGHLRLNDFDMFLRGGFDRNHGLGWYHTAKPFAGAAPDGPALYGWAGGLLGTRTGGDRVALSWNSSQVTIPLNLNFGSSTRQMLNLWDTAYGIGVQANTLYLRSDNNFAWFRDGVHHNDGSNPGAGGTNLMLLDFAGHLQVNAGVTVDLANANNGGHYPGLVFGSPSGESIASKRTAGGNRYGIDFFTGFQSRLSIANWGGIGIGTAAPEDALLDVEGDVRINDRDLFLRPGSDRSHGIAYRANAAGQGVDGPFVYGFNGGALGTAGPDSITLRWDWVGNIWVSNDLSVATLSIRGGADLAEPFPMAADVPKGALVVIDDERPGALKLSNTPYDNRVAGIVSGANGVNPGLTLQQEGVLEGGQHVALTGRVYALADATGGAIKPGDLLTSSSTPGHVMRVTEHDRAQGAVVGKAMSVLKEGKGMVLVLVNLQ